jgi:putative peptidoglycan lipid II flippase
LNVPATIGLIVLAVPIVRVLFEHGRFLPADTEAVASALRLYAIGLVGSSAARIASPVFYALGRNRVPVFVSIAAVAVNIAAGVVLVRVLGFRGLALGTSVAALVHGAALLVLLRHALDGPRLAGTFGKSVAASGAMAVAALMTHAWTTRTLEAQSTLAQAAALALAMAAGLAVLAIAARIARIPEFDEAVASARAQVQKMLDR